MPRAAFLLALLASSASALLPAYKADRLKDLQGQGRIVLVYFTSATCTLCRQQEETLERIQRAADKDGPVILQADYDVEDALRRDWRVGAPSTLVVFRGTDLLDRSTGLVSEDDIRQFVRDAVAHSRGRPRARSPRPVRPKR